MKKRVWRISIVSAIVLCVLTGFVARPVAHLVRTAWMDRNEWGDLQPGYVNDASRLNSTKVSDIWHVPVDSGDFENQLRDLLARAKADGLRVSIAGAQHSMGGHTIYPDGIVIDMLPWKRMELDESQNVLKVQAGALWKDIIPYLDQCGRSVAVMQSNNAFSVGGSISVNCHGWQFGRPPIASTVQSFRLMQADGTVVRCSRTQNPELFSLALGGYGLFGVILDVELGVVPNQRYRLEQYIVPVDQSLATFDSQIENQPGVEMVYARMNIVPDRLFQDVIINAFFREPNGEPPALNERGMEKLRRAIFRGSVDSDYGKKLRWNAETKLQPRLTGKAFSRNQLLNEGVEIFQNRSMNSTDILHEYFVPRHRAAGFVEEMRRIIPKHRADLLNVTVRDVSEDRDSFLRYADQRMIAFVMLFVQPQTDVGEQKMKELTRDLIDAALRHEGRYYPPYRLHATPEQFHQAYPQAREFFELKRKYDPEEVFQNRFYLEYGTRR